MSKDKIIVFKENRFSSLITDLQTFGTIVGSFALSHYLVDSNNWLNAILTVMLVFWLLAKGTAKAHEFYSIDEVVEFLKSDESNVDSTEGK